MSKFIWPSEDELRQLHPEQREVWEIRRRRISILERCNDHTGQELCPNCDEWVETKNVPLNNDKCEICGNKLRKEE